jgi:hypothetical protein
MGDVSGRPSAARLAEIRTDARRQPEIHPRADAYCPLCAIRDLLAELDAVTRERDEAREKYIALTDKCADAVDRLTDQGRRP